MRRNSMMAAVVPAVISSGAVLLLVGCAGPKHISAQEFQSYYRMDAQTMSSATYVGQANGKAYIALKEMSLLSPKRWNERLVYVRLDELDPIFRDALPTLQPVANIARAPFILTAASPASLDAELEGRLADFMRNNPPSVKANDEAMASWDPQEPLKKLDKPLQDRLQTILKEMESIKPGTTRGDLLKVLTIEAGLVSRTTQQHVFPTCPCVKVNVKFRPVGDTKPETISYPDDVVIEVSKPYLQSPIYD